MKYIPYLAGAIIGFAIAFILFGRQPDVKLLHDTIYKTHFEEINTYTYHLAQAHVTGATMASITPDGATVVTGAHLSIDTSTAAVSTNTTKTSDTRKEDKTEKTITYNGSVAVYWEPVHLKPLPSVIDASYVITNPFEITGNINLDIGKFYVGPRLKF